MSSPSFRRRPALRSNSSPALKYAADLSGVDTQGLALGIKALAQNMVSASESTSKPRASSRPWASTCPGGPLPTLEKIATVFSQLEDGELKTALATEIFGKRGMELIPLLNQGQSGIQKLTQEAERLGIVMGRRHRQGG
jgi:hypothetical protein